MSIVAEYPRADYAANNVDPMVMAQALDHIAKASAVSRSQTRRIRWIQLRAETALAGREYRDIDVDLPKKVSGDTQERIKKSLAYHIAVKYDLLAAANAALDYVDALRAEGDEEPAWAPALRAAIAKGSAA